MITQHDRDALAKLLRSQIHEILSSAEFRLGIYSPLGTADAGCACVDDLQKFVADPIDPGCRFVAVFDGPMCTSDQEFERLAERLISAAASIPAVVLLDLHPAASNWEYRFAWPTLVFCRDDIEG